MHDQIFLTTMQLSLIIAIGGVIYKLSKFLWFVIDKWQTKVKMIEDNTDEIDDFKELMKEILDELKSLNQNQTQHLITLENHKTKIEILDTRVTKLEEINERRLK